MQILLLYGNHNASEKTKHLHLFLFNHKLKMTTKKKKKKAKKPIQCSCSSSYMWIECIVQIRIVIIKSKHIRSEYHVCPRTNIHHTAIQQFCLRFMNRYRFYYYSNFVKWNKIQPIFIFHSIFALLFLPFPIFTAKIFRKFSVINA